VFGSGHVIRGDATIEAAGILLLVQENQFPGGNRLLRQPLFFLFRTVNPDDFVGLAHASHLIDPFLQFAVLVHVTDKAF
jgi:hypothetical protein